MRAVARHFVFPRKTKRKLESYDIEVAATQLTPIERQISLFLILVWQQMGLWGCGSQKIRPSLPQLFICDGHRSHNNVEFSELANENDIIVAELPSHTSHWTQPLDRLVVFQSLKPHWNTTVEKIMYAFDNKNSSAAIGITLYSFNSDVFPNEAYASNFNFESG